MAKLRIEDITARMIEEVSEYMPADYGACTKAGIVWVGPNDPGYAKAKSSFEGRLRRKFNGKANR